MRGARRWSAAGLIGALAATAVAAAPAAEPAGPVVVGPAERVFDWSEAACARWDIPDAPARAWRDAAGVVRLIAGAEATRAAAGAVARDARARVRRAASRGRLGRPGAFDDRTWMRRLRRRRRRASRRLATWSTTASLRPGRCAGKLAACWTNAIVGARFHGRGP